MSSSAGASWMQELREEVGLLRSAPLEADLGLAQLADQHRVVGFRVEGLELGLVLARADDLLALQDDRIDLPVGDLVEEMRVAHRLRSVCRRHEAAEQEQRGPDDHDPDQHLASHVIQFQ